MRHGIQVFNGQICICFPLKAFILYVKNRKHLKVGEGEKLSRSKVGNFLPQACCLINCACRVYAVVLQLPVKCVIDCPPDIA